jgi:DNA-directed RNA polymerase subunit RPC12/RpoP
VFFARPVVVMSEFLKYECSQCGQPIQYPAEGTGMTVPCPSCQNPVVVRPKASTGRIVPQPAAPEPAVPSRKGARSNLTNLTAETIRTKIKSGDTPLHRAAKNGQLDLVPGHLLGIELFLEQNNAGETPLHVAARQGHLDQVPLQFLTKETLTCRRGSGTYLTGAGKVAETETVLHVAARYGHTDQIPKEFLAQEYLMLVASGYETTLLEDIAQSEQLELIPEINTKNEIWQMRNSFGRTLKDILESKKEREAYVAEVRSEPITDKQRAKLLWFRYSVRDGMTKGEASDAIDQCIRQNPGKEREYHDRPATEEQIAQLREYANADKDSAECMKEMVEEGSTLTYGEANDLVRHSRRDAEQRGMDRFSNPPDESQIRRLKELGFELDTRLDDIITGADLGGILDLKGAPPREEDVRLLGQHGVTSFQGDGLAAFALGDLIRAFGGSAQDYNRKPLNYHAACQAALSDLDFQKPMLSRDEERFVAFTWPKGKIREWLQAAN